MHREWHHLCVSLLGRKWWEDRRLFSLEPTFSLLSFCKNAFLLLDLFQLLLPKLLNLLAKRLLRFFHLTFNLLVLQLPRNLILLDVTYQLSKIFFERRHVDHVE